MPIYEYHCAECEHRFEVIRPIAQADAPLECPRCAGEQVERAITAAFAHSNGRIVAGNTSGCACGGCSGGSCAVCSS